MTDLRQAAQAVIDRWDAPSSEVWKHGHVADLMAALRRALKQQAEPVAHSVIAGALFDFMGWLTTRKERLVLSSTDNASPAADAIKDFAEMRGLSLDDARVQDWQAYTAPPQQQAEPVQEPCKWATERCGIPVYLAPPQRKPLTDEQIMKMYGLVFVSDVDGYSIHGRLRFARAVEAAHGIKD